MEPIVVVGGSYHGALRRELQLQVARLESRGIDLQLDLQELGEETALICRFQPDKPAASLCRSAVACAVTDAIGDQLREEWVTGLLRREYSYFDPEERSELARFVERRLNNGTDGRGPHPPRRRLFQAVNDYLAEEQHLSLDGFVTFRLRDYRRRMARVVDQAVDEFLLEREYREFVSLLRYFVEHQAPEEPLLHAVVRDDEEFCLLTADGDPLESSCVDRVLADLSRENLQPGDLFVSALVTVAPRRLVVHGLDGFDEETQETVQRVFADRLQHCRGCQLCGGGLRPSEQPFDRS